MLAQKKLSLDMREGERKNLINAPRAIACAHSKPVEQSIFQKELSVYDGRHTHVRRTSISHYFLLCRICIVTFSLYRLRESMRDKYHNRCCHLSLA